MPINGRSSACIYLIVQKALKPFSLLTRDVSGQGLDNQLHYVFCAIAVGIALVLDYALSERLAMSSSYFTSATKPFPSTLKTPL